MANEKKQIRFNFLSKYKLVISIICTLAIIALVYFICSSYKNKPVLNKTEDSKFIGRYEWKKKAMSRCRLAEEIVHLCVFINDNMVKMEALDSVFKNDEIKEYFESIKKNWEIAAPFEDLLSIGVQTQIKNLVLKDKILTGSTGILGKITVTMNENKDKICLISGTIKGKFLILSDGSINYQNNKLD